MRTVAMGLVAVLALAGCTGSTTDKSAPEPSLSVSSSIAAPSPAPSLSPSLTAFESFPPAPANESKDQATVRAAWVKYIEVYEKYASDPNGYSDFSEVYRVATDEEASSILDEIQRLRKENWRAGGGSQYVNVSVNLPSVQGDPRSAVVTYCIDNTHQVIYDGNNKPLKRKPLHFKETATLTQGDDQVWRVSMVRNLETSQC